MANNGGFPYMNIGGLRGIGVGNYTPTIQTVYSLEGVDAVTKVWRNHAFKTGIQVDDMTANISQPPQGRGDFSFNGMYTDIPNRISQTGTGLNGIGDFLVAPAASNSARVPGVGTPVSYVGGMNQILRLQYRCHRRPSLVHRRLLPGRLEGESEVDAEPRPALGSLHALRRNPRLPGQLHRSGGGNGPTATYEMSAQGCAVPRATIFNTVAALSNVNIACNAGLATGNAQKDNFAPRVGFAYKISPTLVVRGGFGTAYGALGNLGYGGTLGFNYPFVYVQTVPAPDSNHPLLLSPTQAATMEQSFTVFNFQSPTVLQSPTPYTDTSYLPDWQLLRRRSIHRHQLSGPSLRCPPEQLPDAAGTNREPDRRGSVLESRRDPGGLCRHPGPSPGYSGKHERQLPDPASWHQYPVLHSLPYFARNSTYETTNAASSYNALQITYQHRMSLGLSLLSNYTWSKCLSDQHAPQNSQYNVGYRAQWLPGFGIRAITPCATAMPPASSTRPRRTSCPSAGETNSEAQ